MMPNMIVVLSLDSGILWTFLLKIPQNITKKFHFITFTLHFCSFNAKQSKFTVWYLIEYS